MKLALHRSITFWSGLLVMGFICWAWLDSMQNFSGLHYGRFGVFHCASQLSIVNGRILSSPLPGYTSGKISPQEFIVEPRPPLFFLRGDPAQRDRIQAPASPDTYLANMRWHLSHASADAWLLSIPYWLFLLAVAFPWAALLLRRARRRARPAG